jgi:hypothetical protein
MDPKCFDRADGSETALPGMQAIMICRGTISGTQQSERSLNAQAYDGSILSRHLEIHRFR